MDPAKEKISFSYLNESGKRNYRKHTFEGIIPNLERRYKETDSLAVREELAKYLNSQICPMCAEPGYAAKHAMCTWEGKLFMKSTRCR